MSTNTCSLIGWLEINQATTQEIDGHETPVLHGFIHTDKTYYGGKHPITLVGKQAQILIDAARQHLGQRIQISLRGPLRSMDDSSRVIGKYVDVLDRNVDPAQITQELAQLLEKPTNGDTLELIAAILAQYGIGDQTNKESSS